MVRLGAHRPSEKLKQHQISISYCAWRANPFFCTCPQFRCSPMLNRYPSSWRPATAFIAVLFSNSLNAETWAITDSAHPLSFVPSNVRVIKLDEQQIIEQLMSQHLPGDPSQAAIAARQMISSLAGRALTQQLAVAQQGVADAWVLRVEKIPAVVVDREYVVYGQPNVAAAIDAVEKRRRKQ